MIIVIQFPTFPEAPVSAKEPARDPGGLEDAFGDLLARLIWGVSQNEGFFAISTIRIIALSGLYWGPPV